MGEHGIWLVANWKMNGTNNAVRDFCHSIDARLAQAPSTVNVVLCPPFPFIQTAASELSLDARLAVGAQDCHARANGAFTGEVSAPQVKEAGARYVIVGHSERRLLCGENDALVLAKAQAAIAAGLVPIICVGESEQEYQKHATAAVLKAQTAGLKKLAEGTYLIAYEPVWAIGSGKTPAPAEISTAHREIKTALGSAVSVLYGGSVKPNNLREILACEGVSGALIGGASLEPDSMAAMVAIAAEHVGAKS